MILDTAILLTIVAELNVKVDPAGSFAVIVSVCATVSVSTNENLIV